MDSTIYRRQDRIGLLRGDKVVLMFCGDANIDAWRSLVLQIDRDFHCQEPLEESGQLFGFGLNLRSNAVTEATVPRGNAYLHEANSLH